MKTSDYGLKKIVGYEGKLKLLPDGRYCAYRCPANVPTIYAGVTKGVYDGMVVTEAEGEAMFAAELAKCEAAVTRLVTVDLNQNEFDALVSFVYNCGEGALQRSTILKRLNKNDREGAAKAFHAWNKARVNGKLTVLRGLTSRRASEAALFLKPAEKPADPIMPQVIEETKPAPSAATVATGAACTGVAAAPLLPIPSLPPAPDLGFITNWWSSGETLHIVGQSASQKPLLVIGIVAWIAAMMFLPKIAERFGWSRS